MRGTRSAQQQGNTGQETHAAQRITRKRPNLKRTASQSRADWGARDPGGQAGKHRPRARDMFLAGPRGPDDGASGPS
ncbi:hypothetical protein DB31_8123 [Hyalangium minutum]|uniref:Uncharacterized protein n=1 Tax=Hyalangium minutum TaxID=394096 RepID=A0A085WIX7_9BACT|nr:hypothetical protein DB31_8123 [Hyalangium minutum]